MTLPPQGWTHVKNATSDWNIYRTRFLVKAKQLQRPLVFVDVLGRQHRGRKGDYLMEWSDGLRRIAPKKYFEDVYVPMESVDDVLIAKRPVSVTPKSRPSARAIFTA